MSKENKETDIDISYLYDGEIETPIGIVKRLKTDLTKQDHIHTFMARWKPTRDCFKISTGIYAIGNPDDKSPVIITGNYKLTLDKLRKELTQLNLWLMIIDTKGINVWCAAGKGTFGTEEIIYRIKKTKLGKLVSHRNIILPQLGAPGVMAHMITKYTNFKAIYGPVRAKDIPEFFKSGLKVTKEMRRVRFNFIDRLVLTPMELVFSVKYIPVMLLIFILLNLINLDRNSFVELLQISIFNTIPYIGALFIGALLVPILLPIVPFKSFSLKGALLGGIWSFIVIKSSDIFLYGNSLLEVIGHGVLLTAISTILALNFTGSTTYTSFSGVQKETIWTFPITIVSSIIGLGLLIASKVIG